GLHTRFKIDLQPSDKLLFSKENLDKHVFTIQSVITDYELLVDKPLDFPCKEPQKGIHFKVLPKIDQSLVYDAVSENLKAGNTVGIFPEGSSHDRTTLLPLKPGVAVMALCSTLEGAEDVMIVPVGFSYEQPHKLQGKATVHFGFPIPVSKEIAQEYQDSSKNATDKILQSVEESLYPPERLTLSTEKYYILHQLVSKLFWECNGEIEMIDLRKRLLDYKAQLKAYRIPDNEVWMLKHSTMGATFSLVEKFYRFIICFIVGIPLSVFWAPLRITASILAERHRARALKESSVKVRGFDVVASYKVMVFLVIIPTNMATSYLHYFCWLFLSLRAYERLLLTIRQINTLFYVMAGKINVWRDTERRLISHRTEMQLRVRSAIHILGPRVSSSFISDFFQNVPKSVLDSDSKRLIQQREVWTPIQLGGLFESYEEIL
ncbi:glycerol-3-phosphate-acyltransferase, partial [Cardiosporidium cionae]